MITTLQLPTPIPSKHHITQLMVQRTFDSLERFLEGMEIRRKRLQFWDDIRKQWEYGEVAFFKKTPDVLFIRMDTEIGKNWEDSEYGWKEFDYDRFPVWCETPQDVDLT